MNISISETAKLTGISVRTLQYYHHMGLLIPNNITEAGYRYYNEENLEKLQQILFYKELEFSLEEIARIMNAKNYKKEDALKNQAQLLQLKITRLEKLLELIHANLEGEQEMNFKDFDLSEIEQAKQKYSQEVNEKWGNTQAYRQSQARTKNNTKEDWERISLNFDMIIKKFFVLKNEKPDSKNIQDLVQEWQNYITENYYDCTKEILAGLGIMYVEDERFKKNLDKFGEGTAEIISKGIAIYCGKN
jgi:DNA-binding transcriptional MerR regulator